LAFPRFATFGARFIAFAFPTFRFPLDAFPRRFVPAPELLTLLTPAPNVQRTSQSFGVRSVT
jgi:hypothetical protein